jgi:chemotaxis protein MotB
MLRLSDLRKRRQEEDDLWPISLADMMTLLLCFFLLIVAVSHVDLARYERVADSMQKALTPDAPSATAKPRPAAPTQPPKPKPAPVQAESDNVRSKVSRTVLAREPRPALDEEKKQSEEKKIETPAEKADAERTGPKRKTLQDIRQELAGKLSRNVEEVELVPRDDGVAISLRGAAFFDSASAEIKASGLPLLREIAATLAGTPYKVTVEGHTDNLPIESWLYPSNWELSSARASRVTRLLIDQGVPKDRMRVEGLADTQPISPNADASGRPLPENQAKNRRVVILVSP